MKLILVDERDNILGYEEKQKCHEGTGIRHRAFSIFIFNSKNQLLIQKRSKNKPLWPGYWANSCCSHPREDEKDIIKCSEKRLTEELGFTTKLKPILKFNYQAKFKDIGSENELDCVLVGKYNGEIKANPEEVEEYKWVDLKELQKDMKNNHKIYAPWFLIAFKKANIVNIFK